jgi:hypothetical protein
MEDFGYKTSGALKTAYMNALIATGRVKDLKSERKKKPVNDVIQITPRGSLVIPKALVDTLGLKPGAAFRVKKSAAGLSLGQVTPPPKTTPMKRKAAPKKPAAKKAVPKKVPPKKPTARKPSAKKRVLFICASRHNGRPHDMGLMMFALK